MLSTANLQASTPRRVGKDGRRVEPKVRKESYAEHNSVFRCKPNDPKQRTWFVFDAALVLQSTWQGGAGFLTPV